MPVRLLLAMLMLTGMMPARVCTCAAAAHSDHGDSEHDEHPCDNLPEECPNHNEGSIPQPCPHDRDCPVANPQASAPPALPTPSPEALTDLDLVRPHWHAPPAFPMILAKGPPHFRSHVGPLPRYLEFRTLLI